jgi:uncharacterized protein YjaZ
MANKIFKKEIEIDPKLGNFFVFVELEGSKDPEQPHLVVSRKTEKSEDMIVTKCTSEELNATIQQVMNGHISYLMEEEAADTERFLKNRGFAETKESIDKNLILGIYGTN